MMDTEPHAVRWARQWDAKLWDYKWTKWHYTLDAMQTLCGAMIPVGLEKGTFLPETDEEASRVDCRKCKRQLMGKGD